MSTEDLARLVQRMRTAQAAYFRTRDSRAVSQEGR